MRHRISGKTLSRDKDHRKALLRNLSKQLILNGSIETTLTKAKFFKPYVEKLVTRAKRGNSFINLTLVDSKLGGSKDATRKLFDDIAKKFQTRAGGYTRITKLGFRAGDRAPMARIEWVADKSVKAEKAKNIEANTAEQEKVKKEKKDD